MEDLLREISLVEVVGCTINICFLGYYSMMVQFYEDTYKLTKQNVNLQFFFL